MSKKIARGSLCVLGMVFLTAQAAEPPTSLDKGEGRLDIIAGRDISSGDKPIKATTG